MAPERIELQLKMVQAHPNTVRIVVGFLKGS